MPNFYRFMCFQSQLLLPLINIWGGGQELTLVWTQQKLLHLRQFLLQLVNIRFEWKCGKDKHARLSRICINYLSKKFNNTSMIIKIWGPVVQNLSRR
jgi:hypothetical protein